MFKKGLIIKQKRKMCKILTKCKLKNQLAQKLLSLGVSMSLMLAMVPQTAWVAEPENFVTSASASHWGRSDLRSYLNGVAKSSDTLPLDTTHTTRQKSGYYESQFTDAEYALVQPFTYSTNVLDNSSNATTTYETTDRFWLPSGNATLGYNQVLSWSTTDISANSTYVAATTSEKDRIIPHSYWVRTAREELPVPISAYWLRSGAGGSATLRSYNGEGVNSYSCSLGHPEVAALKINLLSVIFASAASADSIGADGGAKKISIAESDKFAQKVNAVLPNYGMYLKTRSDESFSADSLSLSGNTLTVNYTNGVQNQYIMVHAFKEDSLTNGHTSYVAAGKISTVGDPVTIDVNSWSLGSLDGYTIKVWMEDASKGASLAPATNPQTFVASGGSITETTSGEIKNPRVFAMKEDLQTSWGSLSELSLEDYQKVISGNAATETGGVVGKNATNQKLYFGEKDGEALEFWIAGRETAANGGAISTSGNIMTLYQAKAVEKSTYNRAFNQNTNDYTVADKKAITLQLTDGLSANYTGSPVSYPELETNVTFSGQDGLQKENLQWQHRVNTAAAWTNDMPTNPGTYEIRCYAPGTDNYERTYSAPVSFKVIGTPTAGDFDFTAPSKLTYDGNPKTATVTAKSGITGMGTVTVKYYNSSGRQLPSAPTDIGTYTVKIDVAEGANYNAATDLTSDAWKFTITPETPSHDDWGTESEIAGIPHWVADDGTTSVEVTENGMIWLKEESGGSSAWYGVDNSAGVFEIGSRFWVRWLNRDSDTVEFANLWDQLDDELKNSIDGDNAWLFEIGVTSPDGTTYSNLSQQVPVYVQIGDDWDKTDLQGYYVSDAQDEQVRTTFVDNQNYPEGQGTFGIMHLSHFSPYFIYDKLTDKEKAAQNQVKTGDLVSVFTISGLGLIMTLALGLMLKTNSNKRKLDE